MTDETTKEFKRAPFSMIFDQAGEYLGHVKTGGIAYRTQNGLSYDWALAEFDKGDYTYSVPIAVIPDFGEGHEPLFHTLEKGGESEDDEHAIEHIGAHIDRFIPRLIAHTFDETGSPIAA